MRAQISDPSKSVTEIHVPVPTDVKAEFVYNFYSVDERTVAGNNSGLPLEKVPRYVHLTWSTPKLSAHELGKDSSIKGNEDSSTPLANNADKIVLEDNFANRDYLSYTFSDVSTITQGASDLENYSRIHDKPTESVFEMAQTQIKSLISDGIGLDDVLYTAQLPAFIDSYNELANFPKDSLGLRVFDPTGGQVADQNELLRTVSNNLSLSVRVNHTVLQDIFKNSVVKSAPANFKSIKSRLRTSLTNFNKNASGDLRVSPVSEDTTYMPNQRRPIKIMGYAVDRYLATPQGFTKEKTFYVENGSVNHFYDVDVIYGLTYVYSIRSVASFNMLAYGDDDVKPTVLELFISSRATTSAIECFEYSPPSPPTNLRFMYDYEKSRLVVVWDAPLNTQLDIKQYQVFRRRSISEPFELIAQYSFDKTYMGKFGEQKYTTGEVVDGNSLNVPADQAYLLRRTDTTALRHLDEDFIIDTEFLESPTYIYSVCSVDAHGMISAYSDQQMVTFDQYKNRLVISLVSESGAPRPYPNMSLRLDAFKDTVRVSGVDARSVDVYFNPDFLVVADDGGLQHKIVEAQTSARPDEKPYYLMQIINLDNQKMQTLKINVKDPKNLTTP